jgi:hypothetical protein
MTIKFLVLAKLYYKNVQVATEHHVDTKSFNQIFFLIQQKSTCKI